MTQRRFADLTLAQFADALGSAEPTPGGGSGAAAVGALGAALVRMLAALTIGKPKYASHDALMRAVADGARDAQARLLDLADEDTRSYEAVGAAYRLPKGTPAEEAARTKAVQAALKDACRVPLKVMEQCLETIGLAKNAVAQGNKNALSDGAAGAEFSRSAMAVAAYNVRVNLTSIEDEAFGREMRTRLDEILYMGNTAAGEIDSRVQDLWKPRPAPPR